MTTIEILFYTLNIFIGEKTWCNLYGRKHLSMHSELNSDFLPRSGLWKNASKVTKTMDQTTIVIYLHSYFQCSYECTGLLSSQHLLKVLRSKEYW